MFAPRASREYPLLHAVQLDRAGEWGVRHCEFCREMGCVVTGASRSATGSPPEAVQGRAAAWRPRRRPAQDAGRVLPQAGGPRAAQAAIDS